MFNFMKYIYLEMNGIDPETARKEKVEEKTTSINNSKEQVALSSER